ncbi:hypothetical protein [Flavobacterium sp. ABG]|uniref:hypothetical protein n=1 Tax=Flavobacterium sp. ABG TaxID=1423322 RepID=UPI00064B17D4|nr:hypothetical protein [Flavobacterium sp. ABG]KLT69721.1 hypothetical protein AB674_10695 [Flavobacterium sp. ABG]
MKNYYVNKNAQESKDHEVHTSDCSHLPISANRKYLGEYASCEPAIIEAKKTYPQSNGCKICCLDCHTN